MNASILLACPRVLQRDSSVVAKRPHQENRRGSRRQTSMNNRPRLAFAAGQHPRVVFRYSANSPGSTLDSNAFGLESTRRPRLVGPDPRFYRDAAPRPPAMPQTLKVQRPASTRSREKQTENLLLAHTLEQRCQARKVTVDSPTKNHGLARARGQPFHPGCVSPQPSTQSPGPPGRRALEDAPILSEILFSASGAQRKSDGTGLGEISGATPACPFSGSVATLPV